MKMFAILQYNGEIYSLGTRIVEPTSSLYSGIVRLALQLGHKSYECIFNFSGLFALLLIIFFLMSMRATSK